MDKIVVQPVGAGWELRAPGLEPQMFRTGGSAENAARTLAEALARNGQQIELHLLLRDGELAAKFLCLPPLGPEDGPLIVGGAPVRQADDPPLVMA